MLCGHVQLVGIEEGETLALYMYLKTRVCVLKLFLEARHRDPFHVTQCIVRPHQPSQLQTITKKHITTCRYCMEKCRQV